MNIVEEKFILPDPTKENLKSLGFTLESEGLYSKTFPIYKWNGIPTIFGRLRIFVGQKEVRIDALISNDQLYHPFYNNEESPVTKICTQNILKTMKNLGIKRRIRRKIYKNDGHK